MDYQSQINALEARIKALEEPNFFSDDQQVTLTSTGSLPSPLLTGQFYYVIDATTNSFKLSLTSGGSAIDITDTGVGVHYWEYIT